jgi:outer membrane protein assembly factor BamD
MLAFLTIFIVGCSGYNKTLKSDDYGKKFEMANSLFESGQEVRSIALYEQIYQRMPKSGEGELSYFRIGKAYYIGKDYYMAGYYLGMFAQRFPSSPKAEDALFLSALCGVQNSPESSLDQNETELAINDLQQFVDRYPNSRLIDSCNTIIDGLRYKLEEKDYNAVQLYSKTEGYRAAVSSSLTFMDDFPMSGFKEEVYFILVKNSYLLLKNSVKSKKMARIDETIERYSNFVALYPESKYRNILANYHDLTLKEKKEFKAKK